MSVNRTAEINANGQCEIKLDVDSSVDHSDCVRSLKTGTLAIMPDEPIRRGRPVLVPNLCPSMVQIDEYRGNYVHTEE